MKSKKSKKADLERKRIVFLQIGLIVACSVVIAAFEWTSSNVYPVYEKLEEEVAYNNYLLDPEIVEEQEEKIVEEEKPDIEEETPPEQQEPEETNPTDTQVSEDFEETSDASEVSGNTLINTGKFHIPEGTTEEPKNRVTIPPNHSVAVPAEFPGGESALFQFLSKNIKYPKTAREISLQGKVYVEFIIGKNGEVKSAKILRGIGAGCDKEALRVVNKMPNWEPAKQAGKKVEVKFMLPVHYQLQ